MNTKIWDLLLKTLRSQSLQKLSSRSYMPIFSCKTKVIESIYNVPILIHTEISPIENNSTFSKFSKCEKNGTGFLV